MLKLHDLQVGQRFTFSDKHRGKVFEVVGLPDGNSMLNGILFQEIDDAWLHQAPKGSKLWGEEVQLHGEDNNLFGLDVGNTFCFKESFLGLKGRLYRVGKKTKDTMFFIDIIGGNCHVCRNGDSTSDMRVDIVTKNRVVELTPHEIDKLHWILYASYTSVDSEEARSEINKIHIKLTGSVGRRVVLPEGE